MTTRLKRSDRACQSGIYRRGHHRPARLLTGSIGAKDAAVEADQHLVEVPGRLPVLLRIDPGVKRSRLRPAHVRDRGERKFDAETCIAEGLHLLVLGRLLIEVL